VTDDPVKNRIVCSPPHKAGLVFCPLSSHDFVITPAVIAG